MFVVGAVHDASNTPALPVFIDPNTPPSVATKPRSHRQSSIRNVVSLEEDHRCLTRGFESSSCDEFAVFQRVFLVQMNFCTAGAKSGSILGRAP